MTQRWVNYKRWNDDRTIFRWMQEPLQRLLESTMLAWSHHFNGTAVLLGTRPWSIVTGIESDDFPGTEAGNTYFIGAHKKVYVSNINKWFSAGIDDVQMHCLRGQRWWVQSGQGVGTLSAYWGTSNSERRDCGVEGRGDDVASANEALLNHTHTHRASYTRAQHSAGRHSEWRWNTPGSVLPSRGNWARLPTRWKHSAALFPLLPLSLLVTFTLLLYFGAAKESHAILEVFRWRWNQT